MTGFVNFLIGALSVVCASGACFSALGKTLADGTRPKYFDSCVGSGRSVNSGDGENENQGWKSCLTPPPTNGASGDGGGTSEKSLGKTLGSIFDLLFSVEAGLSDVLESVKLKEEVSEEEDSAE